MRLNKDLSRLDKLIVFINTGKKILRGFLRKPLLKKSEGLLFIGRNVSITHGHRIECGRNVKFEDYSEIHGLCKDGLKFGSRVTIGRGVMIRPSSYYGIDLGRGLTVGNDSSIGPHGYIGCSGKIIIGSSVMIGPKCSLFAENHNYINNSITIKEQGVKQKGIVIEDNCWIGSNVVILDGVSIGTGSVIGAGALINKDIPPHSLVVDKRNKIYKDINGNNI